MSNQRVTGVAIIKANGVSMRSKGGAKLGLGGLERTAEYADGQLIGSSAKPIAADLTATLTHTNQSDLDALNLIEDDTITFETDSGVTYIINGAFIVSPPELSDEAGGVSVHFMGQPAVRS